MTLPPRVDVAIIGAGQAGLSLSRCLTERNIEHVVLERGSVGESWRSQRWDSFCLVTPNWTIRLAGEAYEGLEPEGFMTRDALVARLEHYASSFSAPVVNQANVESVGATTRGWCLLLEGRASLEARAVVIATATHQMPRVPSVALSQYPIRCVHAADYRCPDKLPSGAVLVVGSGQSGCQIAMELRKAGRDVVLATSRVGRLPRRYRGRDAIEWQARMGYLDRHYSVLDSPKQRFNPDPHLSGQGGGSTIDLRAMDAEGIRLAGRLRSNDQGTFLFDEDGEENLTFADEFAARFALTVDEHVERTGDDASPSDPEDYMPATPKLPPMLSHVSIHGDGISTVVWSTGFQFDFSWVGASEVFDCVGYPVQMAGRTSRDGLHFLGQNYVEHRRSGILYGAGTDAMQLAGVIAEDLSAG